METPQRGETKQAPKVPASAEWMAAAGLVAAGVVAIIDTQDIAFITPFGPGPGFFPQLLGYTLAVLTLIRLLQLVISYKSILTDVSALVSGLHIGATRILEDNSLRFAGLFTFILIYAGILEYLGFLLSNTFYCWCSLLLLRQRLLPSLIGSILAAVVLQLTFGKFLGVQIPSGQIISIFGL